MLFDMVVARLGDLAVVETVNDRSRLTLYRREQAGSDKIIPWPLLRLDIKGRVGVVVGLGGPAATPMTPTERAGEAPRLRNLGPGEIEIYDGPHRIAVTYAKDGRWFETTQPREPSAHRDVIAALARGGAQPTELLATYVEQIDLGRHGPARVLRPVPLPGGVEGVWLRGLFTLRDALFDEQIPIDATHAVVDGIAGSALAWGMSEQEAFEGWQAQVARKQPTPEPPRIVGEVPDWDPSESGPPDPDDDTITFAAHVQVTGPSPDVDWPTLTAENTPAVLVPLAAVPQEDAPWGTWTRLLGRHGETTAMLMHRTMDECTLVGRHLIGLVNLAKLGEVLDRTDVVRGLAPAPHIAWPEHLPALNSTATTYRFVDERTHDPIEPEVASVRQTHGFITRELDGNQLAWQVLRQRWN